LFVIPGHSANAARADFAAIMRWGRIKLPSSTKSRLAQLHRPRTHLPRGPSEIQIGVTLTFVAGAVDAGGFLLLGQFTAHMSGNASSIADHLQSGAWRLVLAGVAAFAPFVGGAAVSAALIGGRLRHAGRSPFAPSLLLESAALLGFVFFYPLVKPVSYGIDLAIAVLAFAMGLQNATSTSLSVTRMRTTQVTGIATDLGLELGHLLYWNRGVAKGPAVTADRAKLAKVGALLLGFLAGGLAGAFGFGRFGAVACAPIAVVLLILALWMSYAKTKLFR
jgi:uncharacterized membrane protein YoaK (UPF0700 family)